MKILHRYIVGHVLGLTALVGLVLMAIHTFISFVADMDTTGKGDYGYLALFIHVLWLTPNGLYQLLPIIAMLGTLMGLGLLAGQSELTAMRAAGVSVLSIGRATLIAGALLGAFAVVLGDWIAPYGQIAADRGRNEARHGVAPGLARNPIWLRDGDDMFHIERLLAEDHIADVEIYTVTPELQLSSAMSVDEMRYTGDHWAMRGVRRTEFKGDAGTRVSQEAARDWQGTLSPEVLHLFVLQANALSIHGLWQLISYLEGNHLDALPSQLAMWKKLIAPLTVMTMMLFAIPFVMGSQRGGGAGQRLLIGVIVGLGFYLLNEVSGNLGQVYRWNPVLAAGAPTAAFLAVALFRLRRAR